MKVKFTKLAALLLAGAALFATGCTDYEVDIQKVDKKVDDLTADVNGKIASIEQQIAGINATIATLETAADHAKDIKTLRDEMAAMKTALENDFNGKLNQAVTDLNAAIDKKLDKTAFEAAKKEIEDALKSANDKIQALELQDQAFKDQIADLTTEVHGRLDALEALTDGGEDGWKDAEGKAITIKEYINQKVVDLEAALQGQINALDVRLTDAEAAIEDLQDDVEELQELAENLKTVVLPKIQQDITDLQTGKLDKSEFNEYKEATAKTLDKMQKAINDLVKLTAGFPEDQTIKEYVDAADEALKDEFTAKYLELVAKAFGTEADMMAMKGNLLGRLEACEALLAGDWGDKTVKQYIDAEVKNLQDQINEINEKIEALDKRVKDLEHTVNDVIMPQIQFAIDYKHVEFYPGQTDGLQGYILDVAYDTFLAATQYTDQEITKLKEYCDSKFNDIYDVLKNLLKRIQSIVFVPDYDDLKITTNVSGIVSTAYDEEGNAETVAELLDQPFKVTYKVTPTCYAQAVVDAGDLLYFDVKSVKTRDEGEVSEETPTIQILEYLDVDNTTGEITMLVQAYNVASETYVSNALHAQYDVELRAGGVPRQLDGYHVWGTDHETRGWQGYGEGFTWSIPVWKYEELKAYEARTAFAASLRLYNPDVFSEGLAVIDDEDFGMYENEVASAYNVLYPDLNIFEIPDEPWKGLDEDEDGDGNNDVREFTTDEQHQTLPYNTLRNDDPDAEDPGIRVILEDAVAVVIIDGKAYGLFPENVDSGMHVIYTKDSDTPILIPEVKISEEAEIEYIKNAQYLDEENYIVDPATYAVVEMNGEQPASARKFEIGNKVQGTYTFTSAFGSFPAVGDVLIVKEQGAVRVDAEAVWTWDWNKDLKLEDEQGNVLNLGDALVDHNIFYGEDGPTTYVRLAWPVAINEEDAAKLLANLDVKLTDFEGLEPSSDLPDITPLVIEVADRLDDEGNEIAEADLAFEKIFPAEETTTEPTTGAEAADAAPAFTIDGVAIKDGKLYANFKNFEWDKVYKVTAVYELEVATITVTGYFKTTDRNREMVTLPKYEYTFAINGFDEETGFGYIAGEEDADTGETGAGYYYWKSEPMHDAIFKVFDEEGVINVAGNVDFEYDDDAEAFNAGELNTHIRAYNEEPGPGTAFKYVDINRQGIYGVTKSANNQISAQDLKDMNSGVQSEDDPYVFLGNVLYRYITTYIGEVVEIPFQFNYRVPAYDFLHQENFTFNDGNWYSLASPKYWENKKALAKYDVEYMNVPALAFNIINSDNKYLFYDADNVFTEDEFNESFFYDDNLLVNFWYTDPELDATPIEEWSKDEDNGFVNYEDLWFTGADYADMFGVATAPVYKHTVFYYRSSRDEIPMYGTLAVVCDGVEFEIPTSFEAENGGKYLAKQDYSDYELRAWKPFFVPEYDQKIVVNLDEHDNYWVNILEGLLFYDARQVAASTAGTTIETKEQVPELFTGEGVYKMPFFNYGTNSYLRPMLGFNDPRGRRDIWVTGTENPNEWWGWIAGNTDSEGNVYVYDEETDAIVVNNDAHSNGFYGDEQQSITSWNAYGFKMRNFKIDDRTGVPASLRQMIEVIAPTEEEIEQADYFIDNFMVKVDYNSQVHFSGIAKVSFSFDFQTPWQQFEKPFTVEVQIKGLDVQ